MDAALVALVHLLKTQLPCPLSLRSSHPGQSGLHDPSSVPPLIAFLPYNFFACAIIICCLLSRPLVYRVPEGRTSPSDSYHCSRSAESPQVILDVTGFQSQIQKSFPNNGHTLLRV